RIKKPRHKAGVFVFGWGTRIVAAFRRRSLATLGTTRCASVAPRDPVKGCRSSMGGCRTRTEPWNPTSQTRKPRHEGGAFCLAGGLGFEPRFTESESVVLPLDDPPRTVPVWPPGSKD